MPSYGTAHVAPSPTVSVTLGPTYATLVNAVLAEFRTTLNAKVTPSGMDMNANLSMLSGAVRYGLTDLGFAKFYAQPTLLTAASTPGAVQMNSVGDLYFNNLSGNQIQVTSGTTLAGTAGSITGAGYGSGGVVVNWDAGTSAYQLKSGSGADAYAHAAVNDLLLNDGSGNFLRVAAPAMAADYTITLPAAVPAATGTLLQFTVGGVASFANTGLTDVALAANSHVTISGTGRYKHGDITLVGSLEEGFAQSGTWTVQAAGPAVGFYISAGAIGNRYVTRLPILEVDQRIRSITAYGFNGSAGAATFQLIASNATSSANVGAAFGTAGAGNQVHASATYNRTVATAEKFYLLITTAAAADQFFTYDMVIDRP